ncbi:unnamed protein product, partial [Pocillopora meandrina]
PLDLKSVLGLVGYRELLDFPPVALLCEVTIPSGYPAIRVADEFHHIQAIYDYPWSFGTHHLHTLSSEPMVNTTRPSLCKASQGLQLSQITVLMIEIFVEISIEKSERYQNIEKNPGAPATVDENKDKAFRPARMRQKDSQIDI